MDETEELLSEELIFLDYEVENKEDLLKKLSAVLEDKGYVKPTYLQGLLDREKLYPTGLNTEGVKVAIPHTDSKHVNKAAIVVATLKKPVVFKEMGNGINDVEANLIFMLAVKHPAAHVETLGKLMSIFSDKAKLISLFGSTTTKEVVTQLSKVLA